jgi:DNA-dependent RNA polymerase auxiliary subunit epsilon
MPYLNNIRVKGPKTRYNNKEVSRLLGVYRFILEYIQNLDKVLADFERANTIVATTKIKLYIIGIKIVEFICNISERHLESEKVIKIIL